MSYYKGPSRACGCVISLIRHCMKMTRRLSLFYFVLFCFGYLSIIRASASLEIS